MIGCGNKTRTQKEVCKMFNNKYPGQHVSQSTISKLETKFRETRHGKTLQKPGQYAKLNEEKTLDVLLAIEDNPHMTSRQLAADNNASRLSILRDLHKEKYHPYKVQLFQELNEDDPDGRQQFCELMMDRIEADLQFINQIVFSDEATFHLNDHDADTFKAKRCGKEEFLEKRLRRSCEESDEENKFVKTHISTSSSGLYINTINSQSTKGADSLQTRLEWSPLNSDDEKKDFGLHVFIKTSTKSCLRTLRCEENKEVDLEVEMLTREFESKDYENRFPRRCRERNDGATITFLGSSTESEENDDYRANDVKLSYQRSDAGEETIVTQMLARSYEIGKCEKETIERHWNEEKRKCETENYLKKLLSRRCEKNDEESEFVKTHISTSSSGLNMNTMNSQTVESADRLQTRLEWSPLNSDDEKKDFGLHVFIKTSTKSCIRTLRCEDNKEVNLEVEVSTREFETKDYENRFPRRCRERYDGATIAFVGSSTESEESDDYRANDVELSYQRSDAGEETIVTQMLARSYEIGKCKKETIERHRNEEKKKCEEEDYLEKRLSRSCEKSGEESELVETHISTSSSGLNINTMNSQTVEGVDSLQTRMEWSPLNSDDEKKDFGLHVFIKTRTKSCIKTLRCEDNKEVDLEVVLLTGEFESKDYETRFPRRCRERNDGATIAFLGSSTESEDNNDYRANDVELSYQRSDAGEKSLAPQMMPRSYENDKYEKETIKRNRNEERKRCKEEVCLENPLSRSREVSDEENEIVETHISTPSSGLCINTMNSQTVEGADSLQTRLEWSPLSSDDEKDNFGLHILIKTSTKSCIRTLRYEDNEEENLEVELLTGEFDSKDYENRFPRICEECNDGATIALLGSSIESEENVDYQANDVELSYQRSAAGEETIVTQRLARSYDNGKCEKVTDERHRSEENKMHVEEDCLENRLSRSREENGDENEIVETHISTSSLGVYINTMNSQTVDGADILQIHQEWSPLISDDEKEDCGLHNFIKTSTKSCIETPRCEDNEEDDLEVELLTRKFESTDYENRFPMRCEERNNGATVVILRSSTESEEYDDYRANDVELSYQRYDAGEETIATQMLAGSYENSKCEKKTIERLQNEMPLSCSECNSGRTFYGTSTKLCIKTLIPEPWKPKVETPVPKDKTLKPDTKSRSDAFKDIIESWYARRSVSRNEKDKENVELLWIDSQDGPSKCLVENCNYVTNDRYELMKHLQSHDAYKNCALM